MILVPVTNQPNQTFTISIPLQAANVKLTLFVWWNAQANFWQMNVTDTASGNLLISSLPMVARPVPNCNILAQFKYLNIGSAYLIQLSSATSDYPQVNDWGTNFVLLWGS